MRELDRKSLETATTTKCRRSSWKIDDDRVFVDIVCFQIDLCLEFSFQAEYGHVSIQPTRVLENIENLMLVDLCDEKIVRQCVSNCAGE